MIKLYIEDEVHKNRIQYVFDYIFMYLGIDYSLISSLEKEINSDFIKIVYGNKINSKCGNNINTIYINQSSKLFSENYLSLISLKVKKIDEIICLTADEELFKEINLNTRQVRTNIDIVSDIFFLITRYEEIINKDCYECEKFNRYEARKSILFNENILDRPIVNEHIELLWKWIKILGYKKDKKNLWEDKEFSVCISHDVDMIFKNKSIKKIVRPIVNSISKEKNVKLAKKILNNYIQCKMDYTKDPFYTFEYILDIEMKNNLKSSFYFMTGGTSSVDNSYSINDKRVSKLIENISKRKCEIGYHGSFNTMEDYNLMVEETNILNSLINGNRYGGRQHYLRFKVPYTWRIQEKVGMLYDTSLGFADKEGFRCGTCYPFKPYDLLEDRIIDIWEIPLIVMDGTLDNKDYNNYGVDEAYNKVIRLISTIKKYNGVFSLLWHNSSLDKYDVKYIKWIPVYEKIMNYLGEESVKSYTGMELIEYIDKLCK
ncbi:polysaccharide deacetylase family protein [Clostridium sp.]|uniref:polysaccharide deacetylase family protein n=1 Tax=Clostridium sp. TaxID=1506 RepID=UPI0034643F14